MDALRNRNMMIVALISLSLLVAFMALQHNTCDLDFSSVCFMTLCALILITTGIPFLVGSTPLLITAPLNRGSSLVFRLDRPPRP